MLQQRSKQGFALNQSASIQRPVGAASPAASKKHRHLRVKNNTQTHIKKSIPLSLHHRKPHTHKNKKNKTAPPAASKKHRLLRR